MEKIPLFRQGAETGEASLERQALYVRLSIRAPARSGLWCAWVVGERGELRIGILEPVGEEAVISRRYSRQSLSPLGRLLRAELRPAGLGATGDGPDAWKAAGGTPLRDGHFRRQLEQWKNRQADGGEILERTEGSRRFLAFPRRDASVFPLPALFCLAQDRVIHHRAYWVFTFDREERPVLPFHTAPDSGNRPF